MTKGDVVHWKLLSTFCFRGKKRQAREKTVARRFALEEASLLSSWKEVTREAEERGDGVARSHLFVRALIPSRFYDDTGGQFAQGHSR